MRHLAHWLPRALMLGAVAAIAGVAAQVASAHDSYDAGHVYVNDNTKGANTIAAYDRNADGTLTLLGTFPAGGAGTGAGLASQGSVQIAGDGRYLIAVDAGSNQLSVLRIRDDGSLAPVPGGVVSSGGNEPVSIAVHDRLVYVANAGLGAENYTGFVLGRGGRLDPLANSTFPLPDTPSPTGSQPGDVLFNSTGTNLVGTRVGSSLIDSFSVGDDGRLTPAPNSPFPAQGVGPFGSEFRPTDPDQLFVSNAHNGTGPGGIGLGTVSAFHVSEDGTPFSIGNSPFPDEQIAPCWVEISHDGRFLFTVNTASGSISRYAITRRGSLILLGSTPVSGQAGVGAVDARLSPDGRDLYVDESAAGAVGEFAVSGGDLSAVGSVPLPQTGTAGGLATN